MTAPTMPADAAEIVRLAERVEQATGPDRELDAAIGTTVGWVHQCDTSRWGVGAPHWYLDGQSESEIIGPHLYGMGSRLPFFTASLDAAMTLVPERHSWAADTGHIKGAAAWCFDQNLWNSEPSYAATPALALTAAALRARAAQHDNEVG